MTQADTSTVSRRGGPRRGTLANGVTNARRALAVLQRDIASCTICRTLSPWRKFGRTAYGNPGTGYLLVGEAPGYVSWRKRQRFTGPAGLVIRRALRQIAHPLYRTLEDLFYMTDVVKCHPARPGSPRSNRSPKPAEVSACSGYLVREIDMLHPSVIVTFGKVAAEGVVHTLTLRASSELLPEVIVFPHPSPRNLRTILRLYPSMRAFEGALTLVFRRLIKRLGRRSTHA